MVPLQVNPQVFFRAATMVSSIGDQIRSGISSLIGTLESLDQMAGSNKAGIRWATGYDAAVYALLKASRALVVACGMKVDVFNTVGVLYHNANAASHAFRRDIMDYLPDSDLDYVSGSDVVISAGGGADDAPEWFHKIEGFLCDIWPDASVTQLHTARDAWNSFGQLLGKLAVTADGQADSFGAVMSLLSTQRTARIDQHIANLRVLAKWCADIGGHCASVARSCDEYASAVLLARCEIVGISVAAIAALAFAPAEVGVIEFCDGLLVDLGAAVDTELVSMVTVETGVGAVDSELAVASGCERSAVEAVHADGVAGGMEGAATGDALEAEAAGVGRQVADLPVPEAMKQGYSPYGGLTREEFYEKYGSIAQEGRYGEAKWPNNGGFAGSPHVSDRIPAGEKLDRIGSEQGNFMGTQGAPISSRSMHPDQVLNSEKGFEYHVYEGTGKRLPDDWHVKYGPAAPAFGQPGGATQWVVKDESGNQVSILRLLKLGVIREK